MKCPMCNNDGWSINSDVILCIRCKQINRTDLFSIILTTLRDIYSANQGFEEIKEKCTQFYSIINYYPLFITSFCTFDLEEHDIDRIAHHYLRNYVISEDNNTLQKYVPVKIDTSTDSCLYKTIATLCRLDVEDGAKELRVRNVIDMVLNADMYYSVDPELHSCLQWGETWRYFVLEQLLEKPWTNGPNTILTLCMQSLSNIINMRIRSVYPKVPGGSDNLRKRLNRIFSPLDIQQNATALSTITILWSNMKHISSHSTSSMWMPNCVVPLLPKPDCATNDIVFSSGASSAALQHPAQRSFYILSCFCPVTQSILNEFVSDSDQKKHSEAEMTRGDTKVSEFCCPKCSKICNDYRFDWNAVALFRQNFSGARLTYILIDITSSMNLNTLNIIKTNKKSSLPRIIQTKEALKQLLQEITAAAGPLDKAILTTFDNKLKNPALIPLCNASDIAQESNLTRIDTIELSPRSVDTHFYSILKEVYEMFEREPYLYVDLYLFSDGVDTSPKKNDTAYQAMIRGLNEKLGAKCHFMNCGLASEGFSVASWLGDADADCPISGGIDEIKEQITAVYKRDHARNPNLASKETRSRGKMLDNQSPTLNNFLTNAEADSMRKSSRTVTPIDEPLSLNSSGRGSNPNLTNVDDYLNNLHRTNRSHSASDNNNRSKSPNVSRIATRNLTARKPTQH